MSGKSVPNGGQKPSDSGLLLDTGVLIAHLRNLPGTKELLLKLSEHAQPVVSAVTVVEVWQGAKAGEHEKTRLLFQGLKVVPLEEQLAEQAGKLAFQLRSSGITIGMADAVIGATARQIGAVILTTNRKHFEVIAGLKVWDLAEMLEK